MQQRFYTLFEKNLPETGGLLYIQSKIYFAKQHLMMDFPTDLDQSKFNPGAAPEEPAEQEDAEQVQDKDA